MSKGTIIVFGSLAVLLGLGIWWAKTHDDKSRKNWDSNVKDLGERIVAKIEDARPLVGKDAIVFALDDHWHEGTAEKDDRRRFERDDGAFIEASVAGEIMAEFDLELIARDVIGDELSDAQQIADGKYTRYQIDDRILGWSRTIECRTKPDEYSSYIVTGVFKAGADKPKNPEDGKDMLLRLGCDRH